MAVNVYLSSLWGAGAQLFTDQGVVLALGTINTFLAGTSTPSATYIDNTGTTQNGVSITLDSAGRTTQELWLLSGQAYKFIAKTAAGVQVGPAYDNISGINDPGGSVSPGAVNAWAAFAGTPTFISATQFSLVGNQTATFPVGTRVKFTVTAGTGYGVVSVSAFGSFTTLTLVNDGTTLDSGLSAVSVSINTVTGPNVGASAVAYNSAIVNAVGSVGADLVAKAAVAATTTTNLNAVSKSTLTAGGTTVYTLTPIPAIAAYVQGQSWLAQANVASTGNPTINISGQGAKNLKQWNSAGVKVFAFLALNGIYELAYDGTDVMVMNPTTPGAASGSLKRITKFTASGTWTKQTDAPTVMVKVVGGGGGGGGGAGTFGGGAGGYAEVYVSAPGATETVTVGAGGAAGGAGTSSSFGAWAVATAGTGVSGAGGVGTTGDIVLAGGAGSHTAAGGGPGGNSYFGGGGGGDNGGNGTAGAANTGGGGGSGSGTGAVGGTGFVVVYEYG